MLQIIRQKHETQKNGEIESQVLIKQHRLETILFLSNNLLFLEIEYEPTR